MKMTASMLIRQGHALSPFLQLSLALRADATLQGGTATVASDGLPRLADDIERLAVKLFVEK